MTAHTKECLTQEQIIQHVVSILRPGGHETQAMSKIVSHLMGCQDCQRDAVFARNVIFTYQEEVKHPAMDEFMRLVEYEARLASIPLNGIICGHISKPEIALLSGHKDHANSCDRCKETLNLFRKQAGLK